MILGDDLIQIDASHTDQGYIMVKTLRFDHRRLKLKIIKDGEEYPYDIDQDGNYITYPLTLGSGQYEIRGYENIEGSRYAVLFKQTFDVRLSEENPAVSLSQPDCKLLAGVGERPEIVRFDAKLPD